MSYPVKIRYTGTAQDLMSIVIRAEQMRYQLSPQHFPSKPVSLRACLESPCNLIGRLLGGFLEILPAALVFRLHEKVFSGLASPWSYPYEATSPHLKEALRLVGRMEQETGTSPAILGLLSHPPVLGGMAHMNFELVRHVMWTMRYLRGINCRPRLVIAVDPFALDTASLIVEGLYAGVMGNYHLGLDRLSLTRCPVSRLLLSRCSWPRMIYRFTSHLREGGELGMVLSGGVISTSRIIYVSREWLRRQRAGVSSTKTLQRLRADGDFALFEKNEGFSGHHSAWRLMEGWLMASLSGVRAGDGNDPGSSCSNTGHLKGAGRETAEKCLQALGLSEERRRVALEELSTELSREMPYRSRIFRVIAERVLKKGRPVVFIPIVHRSQQNKDGGYGIKIQSPWAWSEMVGRRVRVWTPRGEQQPWEGEVEEFASRFVQESFA